MKLERAPRALIVWLLALVMLLGPACGSDAQLGDDAGSSASDAGLDAAPPSDAAPAADTAPAADAALEPELTLVDRAGAVVTKVPYGSPVTVRMEGLQPNDEITIRASFWGYRSHVVVRADEAGTIDLGRDAPASGTYSGVEAEGLIWSMVLEDPEVYEESYAVRFVAERAGAPIAEATLDRLPFNHALTKRALSDDGLVGTFWVPNAVTKPSAAVLVLGGSEGGLQQIELRAAYVASMGYPTLALAYFGVDPLPNGLTNIPLEYFEKGLTWLAAQPEVDGERLVVSGGSRGSEAALMLGARFPVVRAVIATAPSGVRWGSASTLNAAAWTFGGEVLPYVQSDQGAPPIEESLPGGEVGYRLTPTFTAALSGLTAAELELISIAVEQTNGPVLMIGGADDGLWPSCEMSQIALDRLKASGHDKAHGDQLLCLPDAGHFIGTPGSPTTGSYAYPHPAMGGAYMVMGGTPAGTAHANRAADDAIRALLARIASQ